MLLQLAVGPYRLAGRLLRLLRRFLQRDDPLVDFLELAGPFVERREALGDLVEARRDACRLLGHLLERFAERRELRAAGRERGRPPAHAAPLLTAPPHHPLHLLALLFNHL